MLATGVRIGEALAVSWEEVDLAAGIVQIEYTVAGVKDVGLIRMGTKSSAGERTLLSGIGRVRLGHQSRVRKTAATELDRAGLTARQIVDQLGHAKVSMTQDRYLGRRAAGQEAAEALECAYREARPEKPEDDVSAG
jgi:integrase